MLTYSSDRGHLFIQIVSLNERRDSVVHEFDKPREVLPRVLVLLPGDLQRGGKTWNFKKGSQKKREASEMLRT